MSAPAASAGTILFVCTGNVCRSPYMEYALRDMLAKSGVHAPRIASAGTRALTGHAMAEFLSRRLLDRGVDTTPFRAARLDDADLRAAGVIITATREHRREIVRHGTELAERTFTLAQLARLLEGSRERAADPVLRTVGGPRGAADLVSTALAARGQRSAWAAGDDDLDDPWQRSRRTYRRVAQRIDQLLEPVAAHLVAGG